MRDRLLFWGTAAIAVPTLERLSSSPAIEVVGVVTRPDAPAGRHQDLVPSPVRAAATRLGIAALAPERLKDPSLRDDLARLSPDVALVFAYGRIIPETLLAVPPRGTLNLHPSLLPRWRGPSPIQAAILAGDTETGVTLMLLDAEMDHGPVVAQVRVPLDGTETGDSLSATMAGRAAGLAVDAIPRFLSGALAPQEQDHARATRCPMLSRENGRVDWTADAARIERMNRAYDPWPGIWSEWVGDADRLRVKLFGAATGPDAGPSGTLTGRSGRLVVGTGKGGVSFDAVQVEGKKRMTVAELLRGMPRFLDGKFH